MKRILEEFDKKYSNSVETKIVDVWKNPDAGEEYGIRVVPTLIFLDPEEKELYRHEGVMTESQLAAKWEELGYKLGQSKEQAQ